MWHRCAVFHVATRWCRVTDCQGLADGRTFRGLQFPIGVCHYVELVNLIAPGKINLRRLATSRASGIERVIQTPG